MNDLYPTYLGHFHTLFCRRDVRLLFQVMRISIATSLIQLSPSLNPHLVEGIDWLFVETSLKVADDNLLNVLTADANNRAVRLAILYERIKLVGGGNR